MITKNEKLFFIIAVGTLVLALYFKVNVPELRQAADIYVDVGSFVLLSFLVIKLIFRGKLEL